MKGWVLGAALLVACGGRASAPGTEETTPAGGAGVAGATSSAAGETVGGATSGGPIDAAGQTVGAGATGVGPIDDTGLPEEFPKSQCDGPLGSLRLALPCKVGMTIGREGLGLNEVECYVVDGRTALTFGIVINQAVSWIGQPVPMSSLHAISYAKVETDGVSYMGALDGSLTFTQVDPTARGFVATLNGGNITWTDPSGSETECKLAPMQLWGTAGDFI